MKDPDSLKISVSISAWTTIDSEDVNFRKCHVEPEEVITGTEWLCLSVEERSEYVLESVVDVLANSEPVYEEIDVTAGDIG